LSLVEMMVAMAVLGIILLVTFEFVNQTAKLWKSTASKMSAFQEARSAFEAVTRKVSQATLNTYWDYDPPVALGVPTRYVRQSELHFVSGPAMGSTGLVDGLSFEGRALEATSHAIFFQAPLGHEIGAAVNEPLPNLLNAAGFFVQRVDNQSGIPQFLLNLAGFTPETRYRLMEMLQPSEELQVYRFSQDQLATSPNLRFDWFRNVIQEANPPVRPIADNIVALVAWARRAPDDPGPELTANYFYDSRQYLADASASLTRNQLPPLVDVTMVALEGTSAARLEEKHRGTALPLQPNQLFAISNQPQFQSDLAVLTDFLTSENLHFRVFQTAVTIKQAKWSED
jgi:uncharacterized protein (TIGR02599 family)